MSVSVIGAVPCFTRIVPLVKTLVVRLGLSRVRYVSRSERSMGERGTGRLEAMDDSVWMCDTVEDED